MERFSPLGTPERVQSAVKEHHDSCFDGSTRKKGKRRVFDSGDYFVCMDARVKPGLRR